MAQSQAHPDASKPAPNVQTLSQPEVDPCEVPGYILFGEGKLEHVKKAVEENKRLTILVVGSGSSVLPGTDGAKKSYPGRLEEILHKRFPDAAIKVTTLAKSRLTAADMIDDLEKALKEQKPDLVVWQTGTVDAMRGIDPESFRTSLDEGIDHIADAGADLILVERDRPHLAPAADPWSALVYAARGPDVRMTMVDGEVVVRDFHLVRVDAADVTAEAADAAAELVNRAGI